MGQHSTVTISLCIVLIFGSLEESVAPQFVDWIIGLSPNNQDNTHFQWFPHMNEIVCQQPRLMLYAILGLGNEKIRDTFKDTVKEYKTMWSFFQWFQFTIIINIVITILMMMPIKMMITCMTINDDDNDEYDDATTFIFFHDAYTYQNNTCTRVHGCAWEGSACFQKNPATFLLLLLSFLDGSPSHLALTDSVQFFV